MASWVIAALNVRFGWAPPMPLNIHLLGALGFALGWAVLLWAMASNPCFDTTVRIREEGGHAVATGGLYQYVRHPGYVGAILYQLATPLPVRIVVGPDPHDLGGSALRAAHHA